MAESDPLPKCNVLVLSWGHQVPLPADRASTFQDVMWSALENAFFGANAVEPVPYERDFACVMGDLINYELWQGQLGRGGSVRPLLRRGQARFGQYVTRTINAKQVCLFNASVRLNTGGPSTPVNRMLDQMIDEANPDLVLSVGYGGAVTRDGRVGDVVVSTSARYRLPGDLRGLACNGRPFGCRWQRGPDGAWFTGLQFDTVAEPKLDAPTDFYDTSALTDPPPVRPVVVLDERPVITWPLLNYNGFALAAPGPGGRNFLGLQGCAIEMDGAPVALACQTKDKECGFVVGLVVPLLALFANSGGNTFRFGWRDYFVETHAARVAANTARVVRAICDAL